MIIGIHVLRNFPASNLNSDGFGLVKTVPFGGVTRARISSQSIKRSIRQSAIFTDAVGVSNLGIRTRHLPQLIHNELQQLTGDEAAINAITQRVTAFGTGSKTDKKEGDAPTKVTGEIGTTAQILFVDKQEVKDLAEQLLELYQEKGAEGWESAKIREIQRRMDVTPKAVDIAMFGRITTSTSFEKVEAAIQVAHAFSVSAHNTQVDFFAGVDDLDDAAAAMLGNRDFSSSLYYMYANIDVNQLHLNLNNRELEQAVITSFIKALTLTVPTGKRNSFAHFTPADFLMVECRDKHIPINYANAFLSPVEHNVPNILDAAIKRFLEHVKSISTMYTLKDERAILSYKEIDDNAYQVVESVDAINGWIVERLPQ